MKSEANGVSGTPDRGHYIVVGAGFGGLAAAIELARKGISVKVIESAKKLTLQGKRATSVFSGTNHLSDIICSRRHHSDRIQCDQSDFQVGQRTRPGRC